MTKIGAFFKFLDLGPKFWDFVKNALILLIFGVMNSFSVSLLHIKYEQNRSIFDDAQNFGPNFFDNTEKQKPKIKICCLKKTNLP